MNIANHLAFFLTLFGASNHAAMAVTGNEARTKVLLRGAVRIDESGYDVASYDADGGAIATSDVEWPGASEKSGDTSGDAGDGYCAPYRGICDTAECCGGEECCEVLPEGSYPRSYTSLCSC